jgi:hypothetical protein
MDITKEWLLAELADCRAQRDTALVNLHRCNGAEAQLIALIAKCEDPVSPAPIAKKRTRSLRPNAAAPLV